MNYLIINSHPYEGSFNIAAAQQITAALIEKGNEVVNINLITDGFNPVMTSEDLRLWTKGQSGDPLVQKYMAAIEQADTLIFPFPVWWGLMPAILKGFLDKVLLPGWAYDVGSHGEMIGRLIHKKAVVITTMQSTVEEFKTQFNDPIEGAFIKDTLQVCGFDVIKHFIIDKIVTESREYTQTKMNEIITYFN